MGSFTTWWSALQPLTQWFFIGAAFFSVFLLAQMVIAFLGMGGDGHDLDTHVEPSSQHESPNDAQDSVNTFKMLSLRSVLSFFTLFTWAGALYMSLGLSVARALLYSLIWGFVALVLVSLLMHLMRKLSSTGTMRLASCVGNAATVYLDIPAGGTGEIRVVCSGIVSVLKARARSGAALPSGTPVRVTAMLEANVVEVDRDGQAVQGKGNRKS